MAVGMATQHRKTTIPLDDDATWAEVNMCTNDTAMDVYIRRCRREPFMQYKSDASTVGGPIRSIMSDL